MKSAYNLLDLKSSDDISNECSDLLLGATLGESRTNQPQECKKIGISKKINTDTEQNFLFLNERIATKYNPFYKGEYLVIQTYLREKKLIVEHSSFDYQQATSSCELKNLAHDYSSSDEEDDDFEFDDQLTKPIACIGCANYHGVEYGGNVLVCAMQPQGWNDENCPDFCS
ncbi:hypothetical protein [Dendronalium sp. ChiSLP03b]|uniref:hypothetical protein n=1 Tax=Dendronalium sp. ChiSLP03b TaxID=3075381 RepID=UPI0039193E15